MPSFKEIHPITGFSMDLANELVVTRQKFRTVKNIAIREALSSSELIKSATSSIFSIV